MTLYAGSRIVSRGHWLEVCAGKERIRGRFRRYGWRLVGYLSVAGQLLGVLSLYSLIGGDMSPVDYISLGLILAPCSWVSVSSFLLILVSQSIHLGCS